jgi:2-polyprenyl-6-methoxyphenol hydroxylase-like FAD-dependent oxidoreductase
VSNSNDSFDLLIVGGGLAGASLGRSMALAGFRVLIIEKEVKFRDRIRGEVLLPWGSVEAKDLGIYDILLQTCAQEAAREHFFYSGKASEPRDYRTSTPKGTCILSFYHPEMQEILLEHALQSGAEVWRSAVVGDLRLGALPEADIIVDGETRTVNARLLVGADGRESQIATLLEFERSNDAPELFIGGLQLAGDLQIEHAMYYFLNAITGRGSILVKNRPGNFRAYLLHHKDALPRRLSGERDFAEVMRQFRETGIPGAWLENLTPHGIFATFDGAHRWITNPARGNCVLIGDAASASDPVWGNGQSRTLRDVRLLRDQLLEHNDWTRAVDAYATEHDDFFQRLRRAERLNAALHFTMGDAAEARRQRAYELMDQHSELNPDVTGLGPEAPCNNHVIKSLLGEEYASVI